MIEIHGVMGVAGGLASLQISGCTSPDGTFVLRVHGRAERTFEGLSKVGRIDHGSNHSAKRKGSMRGAAKKRGKTRGVRTEEASS